MSKLKPQIKDKYIPIKINNKRIILGQSNKLCSVSAVYNQESQLIAAEKQIVSTDQDYINEKKKEGNSRVVQLLDQEEDHDIDKNIYSLSMYMEQGISLQKLIIKRQELKINFSQKQLCCLIEGILLSLLELEARNIAHRDIKPDNFLFIPLDFSVKICDFGEAIVFKELNTVSLDNFRTLQAAGTTTFMSPEMKKLYYDQIQKSLQIEQTIDFYKRSDIFSLGLVLLHLIVLPVKQDHEFIFNANHSKNNLDQALELLKCEIEQQQLNIKFYNFIEKMLQYHNEQRTNNIIDIYNEFLQINQPQTEQIFDTNKENITNQQFNIKQFKGQLLKQLQDHQEWVTSIIKVNKNQFLTGSHDKTIKLWDISQDKPVFIYQGHTKGVNSILQLSQEYFASGSSDNTIKIWSLKNKDCTQTLKGHNSSIYSLCLFNNNLLSSGFDNKIISWNLENFSKINQINDAHNDQINSLIQFDQNIFISASNDKSIKIWESKNYKSIKLLSFDDQQTSLIKLSDNNIIAGSRLILRIITSQKWECQQKIKIHSDYINQIQLLTSNIIVTSSADKTAIIYDIDQNKELFVLKHNGEINGSCILNSNNIITVTADKTIKIWY